MAKAAGCLLGLVGVALCGGAAFVHLSDSDAARQARAKIAEWGLDVRRANEKPPVTPPPESGGRKQPASVEKPTHKPAKPATAPGGDPASVNPPGTTGPATPTADPGTETWGPLDAGAGGAEAARKADAAARIALDRARAAYESLDLPAATAALDGAIADRASADLRDEAAKLEAHIALAAALTADIERNELADHTNVVEVELVSGRTREGRLVRDDGRSITLAGDYGISATFPRDQVRSIRPLSPAERRAKLTAQLTAKRKQYADPSGLELFKLAEWCVANGLESEAVALIEEASAREPRLAVVVHLDRAARLFHHWLYLRSRRHAKADDYAARIVRDFGDTPYAAQIDATEAEMAAAREAARRGKEIETADPQTPETAPTPAVVDRPDTAPRVPAGSTPRSVERQGDEALAKAEAFAEAAQPGKPDANANNKKAIEWFRKAMALYEQAGAEAGATDRDRLERKLEEAGTGLYWAKKMQHLG